MLCFFKWDIKKALPVCRKGLLKLIRYFYCQVIAIPFLILVRSGQQQVQQVFVYVLLIDIEDKINS
jgi:hypothetical protein